MDRYRLTRKIAVLGIGTNVFLLSIKLAIGFISKSQAMIADGFNSAGDVFASTMTYTGNKIASRPEDKNHPFGHGKAEYIFSMIVSFSLLLVAYKIFMNSLSSIINRAQLVFSWWLVAVASITIILKLILFLYTRSAGKSHDSLLILANSEDHRNDVFVTASTLIGIFMSQAGIYWFDGIIGIFISLWIAFTGVRIFYGAYKVLMDTNFDETYRDDIYKAIESIDGVDHIDNISAKPVGIGFIVIAKVSVNGTLSVNEGHSIAARIKEKVKTCKNIKDVIVHINPA
ncbi:MAG: cation diffusion facilitator family transporter [Clostridia bacterium]|nr:cation diffusion facilitator family transporter [Clostridia bacterium]